MADDGQQTRSRLPRGLSIIALERAIARTAKGPPRPTIALDGTPSGETSWLSRARAAVLRAAEDSLSAGQGPAWLVLALATGLVGYFALPHEPALWALYPAVLILVVLAYQTRHGAGFYVSLMLAAGVAGVLVGAQTARLVDAPQILVEDTMLVIGSVVRVEQREANRARLTLDRLSLEDRGPSETPARVRVTVVAAPGEIAPGDRVELLARLGPPPEPVMPGARNLRLELYFEGIGGTGFSYGRARSIERPAQEGWSLREMAQRVERLRAGLSERFGSVLPGDTGSLASALLVGKREGLSEETYDAMRRSGLAHLLAISGMHMAMMTLSTIALVHLLVAFHPSASASRGAMRWAGLAGLVIASFYLVLSGASTSTQRAYIMIVLVLVAMIASRRALTIRGVAFAALIVLVLHPASLLGPSFQMSFAATLALVAVYGAMSTSTVVWKLRTTVNDLPHSGLLRPLAMVTGIALTSLIAGFATAPYAAYHFSVGAPLGLIGNVLALPLVSLIIMPAGLLALLLTPFALEGPPLLVMGFGLDLVLVIARWVAAMDGSQVAIRAITPQALLLLTLAGCLAAFLVGHARWVALPVLACAWLAGPFQPMPLVLVEQQAATVALRLTGADGQAYLDRSVTRGSAYTVDMWQQRLAMRAQVAPPTSAWTCDPLGCIARLPEGQVIAHVQDFAALEEDCRLVDILVTPLEVSSACQASLIVDATMLRDHGAIALVADADAATGVYLWTSFTARARPWEAAGR